MPSVSTAIEKIFSYAASKGASDVHLIVGKMPLIRIDGVLQETDSFAVLTAKSAETIIMGMLTETQQKELYGKRELDSSYAIVDGTRFRVNCHFEKDNPGLVARIIPNAVPAMKDLGMAEVIFRLTRLKQGFVLVTGPTGCGKSTSLAAMIRQINEERAEHIVTLEDPIEYLHEPVKSIIRQRQLGTDFLSFAEALKHVMRQDPNVILVGEMRDFDTIAAAITLAETGHLVLATLHTNNSAETIDRIIDVFPPYQQDQIRLQLSMSLEGVISQRLMPKIGGGRIAAREILINTPAVANMIRENKIAQIKTALQTGTDEGMTTMDQDIKLLFQTQMITEETAQAYISDPRILR